MQTKAIYEMRHALFKLRLNRFCLHTFFVQRIPLNMMTCIMHIVLVCESNVLDLYLFDGQFLMIFPYILDLFFEQKITSTINIERIPILSPLSKC